MTSRQGRDLQRWDGTRRLTSGGVCVTKDNQILLVSSRNNAGEWTLPKGGWDSDETKEECAIREAWEEGGVIATVTDLLGVYDVNGGPVQQKPTRLHIHLMAVTLIQDDWPEAKERQRRWVSLEEALAIVTRPGHIDALNALQDRQNKTQ